MRAYTKVGIWGGNARVPFPVEVQFGDHGRGDAINIRQARTLIRQLERTIKEVQRCRRKRSSK